MAAIRRRSADHKVFDGDEMLVRYAVRDWKRCWETLGLNAAPARSTTPPLDRRMIAATPTKLGRFGPPVIAFRDIYWGGSGNKYYI